MLGKNGWMEIPTSNTSDFHDCIIFDGKIYAINSRAELWVSNIETPKEMVNLGLKRLRLKKQSKLYLVKMDNDDLLMIERRFNIEFLVKYWNYFERDYETVGFNLFKMDSSKEKLRWIKVNNLDDYCVFLGLNTSICYRGSLNGNHIYYSDDQTKRHVYDFVGGHDFGVYDIANESCRRLLDDQRVITNFVWPPPVWVTLKN
ncbi:putative F-box protein At2g16290 [Benincasa hispida]|uniref:putative F-box protein At2g16290 n=1 Tax=Benincasa hispida TaxID=102211 RepID=UPI001901F329|nr:putative F-box protein At2g16290 [Benincasa hispida]